MARRKTYKKLYNKFNRIWKKVWPEEEAAGEALNTLLVVAGIRPATLIFIGDFELEEGSNLAQQLLRECPDHIKSFISKLGVFIFNSRITEIPVKLADIKDMELTGNVLGYSCAGELRGKYVIRISVVDYINDDEEVKVIGQRCKEYLSRMASFHNFAETLEQFIQQHKLPFRNVSIEIIYDELPDRSTLKVLDSYLG